MLSDKIKKIEKDEKFFLSISSSNLAHYFQKGCICACDYIKERNDDIQTKFINKLLISTHCYLNDSNCSLELSIGSNEDNLILIKKGYHFLNKPIPISRIKAIYFQNQIQLTNTHFNINAGAAYIPNILLKILEKNKKIEINLSVKELEKASNSINWKSQIEHFDKLMGGFSFMKISDKIEEEYTSNYLYSLSKINDQLKIELKDSNIIEHKDLEWFISPSIKLQEFKEIVYSKITKEIVENYARNKNIKIEYKNGMAILEKLVKDKLLYIISILHTYGEAGRKTIDDFINDYTINTFNINPKENLALSFGINTGYNNLRNKYKINEKEFSVKFKLTSKIDYYTIESIYQYTFNNIRDNKFFILLDDWIPQGNTKNKIGLPSIFPYQENQIEIKKAPIISPNINEESQKENVMTKVNEELIIILNQLDINSDLLNKNSKLLDSIQSCLIDLTKEVKTIRDELNSLKDEIITSSKVKRKPITSFPHEKIDEQITLFDNSIKTKNK